MFNLTVYPPTFLVITPVALKLSAALPLTMLYTPLQILAGRHPITPRWANIHPLKKLEGSLTGLGMTIVPPPKVLSIILNSNEDDTHSPAPARPTNELMGEGSESSDVVAV